jgi:cytochrome c-type biogenesis protein CcmH
MPISLLIIACLMLLAAAVAILWPYLRRAEEADALAREKAALKGRLVTVDRDAEAGTLSAAEADAARAEIARRFASLKAETTNAESVGGEKKSFLLATISVVVLGLVTSGLYLFLGSPNYADQPFAARQAERQDINGLIAQVEDRLKQNPDDVDGWAVLGPVYMRSGQFDLAATAFGNMARLTPKTDPRYSDLIAIQAEAMIAGAEGSFPREAIALIDEAIALNANNAKAAFLKALSIEQSGDRIAALDNWRAISERFSDDPQLAELANQRVAILSQQPAAPPVEQSSGPSRDQVEAAADMSADDQMEMIAGMVSSLASRLRDNPNDLEGWERLIRSYMVLGQQDDARAALEDAKRIFVEDGAAIARLQASFDAPVPVLKPEGN